MESYMKVNETKPTAAGKSSYDLIDVDKFFKELDLQAGISFLDLACGRGAYCQNDQTQWYFSHHGI